MNGIELRQWLMNHFLNLPVILMSGYGDAATELDADAVYLNNPIKPLELHRALEKQQVGR
jgi:FixJ family two-component response regulator